MLHQVLVSPRLSYLDQIHPLKVSPVSMQIPRSIHADQVLVSPRLSYLDQIHPLKVSPVSMQNPRSIIHAAHRADHLTWILTKNFGKNTFWLI